MIVESVGTAVGLLAIFYKFDIRKVLGYEKFVDVACFILIAYLFSGTVSGMIIAMLSGLLISVILALLKKKLGFKVLRFKDGTFKWVEYRPVKTAS